MSSVNILIGGDVCPIRQYERLFIQGSQEQILGPFAERARRADLFLANLECPLIHQPTPIVKTGPIMGGSASCALGLKAMGLHAMGIANNHIMDHGLPGLQATLEACSTNGITLFGAGASLELARKVHIRDVKGVRVGMVAMAEREWSMTSSSSAGANPLDVIEFVRQMKVLRKQVDFLVVLLHAGCLGYQFPSPSLRKVCQFLVEEGANVVTCQHSHCVGSYEKYLDQLIVYGQGSMIFDYETNSNIEKKGILISMDIQENGKTTFELVPFTQGEPIAGLASMAPEEEVRFIEALEFRSKSLAEEGHMEACWEAYCQTRKLNLLNEVLGHGRILRRLNRNGAIIRMHGRPYLRNLLSVVQNESAVETLNTLLRSMLR